MSVIVLICRPAYNSQNFIKKKKAEVMLKKSIQNFQWNTCLLQLQDFDMWVKLLLNGPKIMYLPEKLTYIVHDNNLSGIQMKAWRRQLGVLLSMKKFYITYCD